MSWPRRKYQNFQRGMLFTKAKVRQCKKIVKKRESQGKCFILLKNGNGEII